MIYNLVVMDFQTWLNRKMDRWIKETGRNQTAFAGWLGVQPTTLSNWIKRGHKPRPDMVARLSEKLGPDIYKVLGLSVPGADPFESLPPSFRERLERAAYRLDKYLRERSIPENSPEAEKIANEIFSSEFRRMDNE
ncbi:MAG TPA: helix-turn-helix transcriptional regulator [Anaerolineaceae bacterium]|nr:helix-turn-helix transcriptional regulator [Anaerolineaceae bacterium]